MRDRVQFDATDSMSLKDRLALVLRLLVYGAGAGGAAGGILTAVPHAGMGGTIGAIAVGILGVACFLYAALRQTSARSKILGLIFIVLLVAFVGGAIGLLIESLVVTCIGTIPGGLAG